MKDVVTHSAGLYSSRGCGMPAFVRPGALTVAGGSLACSPAGLEVLVTTNPFALQ